MQYQQQRPQLFLTDDLIKEITVEQRSKAEHAA